MNNTQISLIAENYADALIKLGQDNSVSYDDILNSLNIIKEVCDTSKDLTMIFANPTISNSTKFSMIDEIFSDSIQENVKNFLKVIIEKKRFNELNGIIASFTKKLDEINSIKRVEVTSAIEMDENIKQKILEKLQLKLHQNVIAEWKVDTSIIGGLVVKVDDDVIDSSLKCKLENLSKHII